MIESIRKISILLPSSRRRRAAVVFALMLGSATVEMAGIASIMPFVGLLMNPGVVESSARLKSVYDWFGFASIEDFLLAVGLFVMGLFLFSLALRALTQYAILRISATWRHELGCRLLAAYLRQPYEFFLGRNTAALAKSILSEVGEVTTGVMVPAMTLISGMIVVCALVMMLVIVEPFLSLAVAAGLGSAYGILHLLTRHFASRVGAARLKANQRRFILTSEVLAGIKELRLLGREDEYLRRFAKPSLGFARYSAAGKILKYLPRYGVEAVAVGGMMGTLLYLMLKGHELQNVLPVFVLYVFAVYRLLPAFQQVFASISQIRINMPAVDSLYVDLVGKEHSESPPPDPTQAPLVLRRDLRLKDVTYFYPGSERPAVAGINLTIKAGSSAAFVGSTGSGKSTIVDIVLGVLRPTEGELMVDGQPITISNVRTWQRSLGYVPQSIFLADDTVEANIAFGLPPRRIDPAEVERVARFAQIHDFVVNELPHGYQTVVGERGVRLSGGQRQRLAIARALYNDPDVIVFDEATSALDNATEAAVMDSIERLRGQKKTIIMIAHRLTTVRNCDCIFLLDGGRLIEQGDYDSLMAGSAGFRRLAAAE